MLLSYAKFAVLFSLSGLFFLLIVPAKIDIMQALWYFPSASLWRLMK
jgi:hypothetical protein